MLGAGDMTVNKAECFLSLTLEPLDLEVEWVFSMCIIMF